MPPEQCPECGRFLKRALVDGLADAPAPCPKCGVELTAAMFGAAAVAAPALAVDPLVPGVAAETPVPDPLPLPLASSVRPPDLEPDEVRGGPDPLEGWDAGVPTGSAAIVDQRPFPIDAAVVAGAALLGAALGATLGRRPVRDATLAAFGGAVGAGLVRRIWQLP
ncbi:hypothetical protein [Nitriliruptor alkaliphilus]|uniref:hypothetical protein n=1 Tax=Nitriliruptor alkaliphilus TaxID=427918 RepID=UPI0006965C99|nr:hypothetical protein [Nitriliruptor alkaliphilus]